MCARCCSTCRRCCELFNSTHIVYFASSFQRLLASSSFHQSVVRIENEQQKYCLWHNSWVAFRFLALHCLDFVFFFKEFYANKVAVAAVCNGFRGFSVWDCCGCQRLAERCFRLENGIERIHLRGSASNDLFRAIFIHNSSNQPKDSSTSCQKHLPARIQGRLHSKWYITPEIMAGSISKCLSSAAQKQPPNNNMLEPPFERCWAFNLLNFARKI